MKRRLVTGLLVVAAAAGVTGAWFYAQGRGGPPKSPVTRVEGRPLTATVSAMGRASAVITVQVKQLLADVGFCPAREASRLNPIEVLRHG